MTTYNEKTIISEFRSGKSIDKIAGDMFFSRKGDGTKTTKYDCKREVETVVLKYILSVN